MEKRKPTTKKELEETAGHLITDEEFKESKRNILRLAKLFEKTLLGKNRL